MKCLKRRAIARKTTELVIFLKSAYCLLYKLRIYLVLANFNTNVRAIAIIISSILKRYMRTTSGRVCLCLWRFFELANYANMHDHVRNVFRCFYF